MQVRSSAVELVLVHTCVAASVVEMAQWIVVVVCVCVCVCVLSFQATVFYQMMGAPTFRFWEMHSIFGASKMPSSYR